MSVNFLGVGSGLELQSMLDNLVKVATEPKVAQLGQKEQQISGNISGLGKIKSALSDFQDSVDALKSTSLFDKNTASVVQPGTVDVLTAEAQTNAVPGTYNVSVEQLAAGSRAQSGTQFASSTAALGGAGTLTFTAGSSNFNVSVTGTESLEDIVTKINDDSNNFGVSATIVDGYLVYKSSVTGAANNLAVTNDSATLDSLSTTAFGGGAGGVSVVENSANARIIVDGITVENSTNTFDSQITGLKLTAVSADPGKNSTITVAKDTGSVSSAISAMATAYNKVIEELNKQHGTTDDEGNFTAGPMFGESIVRQLNNVLADSMSTVISGAPSAVSSMASFGLDLQDDGTISVDSSDLNSAISNNFDQLASVFTGSSGFATQLSDQLETYVKFGGILDGAEDSYESQLDDIEEQYADHIQYITSYKETLQKQFVNLDKTIGQLNATMSYVTGQLAQLARSSS